MTAFGHADHPVVRGWRFANATTTIARMGGPEPAVGADEVIAHERRLLGKRDESPLVGLALSGGGVRSATFNLGVLEELAERKQLQHLDYVSCVSGGGYLSTWLQAFLRHTAREDSDARVASADKRLSLHHLRESSSYLTPTTGLASADT